MKLRDRYALLFLIICTLISCIPVLTLNYYEFAFPFMWTIRWFGIPLLITSVFLGRRYILKIWIKEIPRPETQGRRIGYIILFSGGIFFCLLFPIVNLIITCDAFIGGRTTTIDRPITKSYSTRNRGNNINYYIEFTHPEENRTVVMAVDQTNMNDTVFRQQVNIGCFGLISK